MSSRYDTGKIYVYMWSLEKGGRCIIENRSMVELQRNFMDNWKV